MGGRCCGGRAVMERLESRCHFSADLSAEDRDLQELIIRHEGMVLYVYPDSMGNPPAPFLGRRTSLKPGEQQLQKVQNPNLQG